MTVCPTAVIDKRRLDEPSNTPDLTSEHACAAEPTMLHTNCTSTPGEWAVHSPSRLLEGKVLVCCKLLVWLVVVDAGVQLLGRCCSPTAGGC